MAFPNDRAAPKFPATHWTVIVSAEGDGRDAALEKIYRAYWGPLCAQARRFGVAGADIEDVVQDVMVSLAAGDSIGRARPGTGRFRSYLIGALRNHLSHRRARQSAAKRGAGEKLLPLDLFDAPDAEAPDFRDFDADWARALLDLSARRFESEESSTDAGKESYTALADLALGDAEIPQGEVARRLGITVAAVKSRVFRMRARFHDIVREEVMRTVSCDAECDDELRYLASVISRVNGAPSFPGA